MKKPKILTLDEENRLAALHALLMKIKPGEVIFISENDKEDFIELFHLYLSLPLTPEQRKKAKSFVEHLEGPGHA